MKTPEETKWNHIHYAVTSDPVIKSLHEVLKKTLEISQIIGIEYVDGITQPVYDTNTNELIGKIKSSIYERIDQIHKSFIK